MHQLSQFPRLIAGGLILAGFALMGNGLHRWCGIPLPGAVVGLILLTVVLAVVQRASASQIKRAAALGFLLALRNRMVFSYLWGRISGERAQQAIFHKSACPLMQEQVHSLIVASERQILEVQLKTGFDGFWRAYFWLIGRQ
jgi:hypothetical protein